MILTVQFVESTKSRKKKVLGVCNMDISTSDFKSVKKCYAKTLNNLLKNKFNGNAAQLLQKASELVLFEYQDMILLSVDDNRKSMGKLENTICVELGKGIIN